MRHCYEPRRPTPEDTPSGKKTPEMGSLGMDKQSVLWQEAEKEFFKIEGTKRECL
jgi:hypothetical protein